MGHDLGHLTPKPLFELRWDAFVVARVGLRYLLRGIAVDVLEKRKGAANGVLVTQIIGVKFWNSDIGVLTAKNSKS